MKVVFVSNFMPPEALGGAEIFASDLAHYLASRGFDIEVVTGTRQHRRIETVNGVNYYRVARPPPGLPITSALFGYNFNPWGTAVSKVIRRIQPDVVHVHNIHTTIMLAPLIVTLGNRVVAHIHDHWPVCYRGVLYDPWVRRTCVEPSPKCCFDPGRRMLGWANLAVRKQLLERFEAKVGVFVSPSEYMRQTVVARGFTSSAKSLHIPLGVNTKSAPTESAKFRELLFVGRLVTYKNPGLVLRLLPELIDLGPKYRIFGAGPERSNLLRLAKQLGVESHVKFEGYQPRETVLRALARATALVIPSIIPENSPLVLYESLLAGTPALVTSRGGARELVADGKDGYVLDPEDESGWRDRLEELLSNPNKSQQMGNAGREKAIREYSIDRSGEAVIRLYDRV